MGALIHTATGFRFPISAGFRSIDNVHKTPHSGVDIAMPEGTPLHAVADGFISKVDTVGDRPIGQMVRIDTDGGPDVIYGHLSQIKVKPGDHVHAGDVIALSGNTGHSTGPHLHLQLVDENGGLVDPTAIAQLPALPPSAPSVRSAPPGLWKMITDPAGAIQHLAAAKTEAIIYGILEGLKHAVIAFAYPVALFGGGLCIILQAAGWPKGYRWLGILMTAYLLIRYFIGG